VRKSADAFVIIIALRRDIGAVNGSFIHL